MIDIDPTTDQIEIVIHSIVADHLVCVYLSFDSGRRCNRAATTQPSGSVSHSIDFLGL